MTDHELLHTADHIDIYYSRADHWLYVDWKGYQSVDMVKSGCEQILSWMVARGTTKVLNDNTHVEGIWIGASEWGATDWFPRMREGGLQQFAWVYSPSRLSQISTDAMVEMSTPGYIKVFDHVDEAAAWLRAAVDPQVDGG